MQGPKEDRTDRVVLIASICGAAVLLIGGVIGLRHHEKVQFEREVVYAIDHGLEQAFSKLLGHPAFSRMGVDRRSALLLRCCAKGRLDMVKLLIDKGILLNVEDPDYGYTPLMFAAKSGNTGLVSYLLEKGCPVDEMDNPGNTALTFAFLAQTGRMETIEALLDAGADPLAGAQGFQPIGAAILESDTNAIAKLLDEVTVSIPPTQKIYLLELAPSAEVSNLLLEYLAPGKGPGKRSNGTSNSVPPRGEEIEGGKP